MKYAIEMGSGAMIYIHTEFHKNWFSYSKAGTHRQDEDCISLLLFYFFQNKGSGLKPELLWQPLSIWQHSCGTLVLRELRGSIFILHVDGRRS
jgi:hypothetical protein